MKVTGLAKCIRIYHSLKFMLTHAFYGLLDTKADTMCETNYHLFDSALVR